LHGVAVVLLSLWILPRQIDDTISWVMGSGDPQLPLDLEPDLDLSAGVLAADQRTMELPGARSDSVGDPAVVDVRSSTGTAGASSASPVLALNADDDVGDVGSTGLESLADPLAARGGGLDGRRVAGRLGRALKGGGSRESEAAVEAGLEWLAAHQYPDGGWRFDLEHCPNCGGYCRNSGTYRSSTAATGLALLAFLGGGYTHQDGKYQDVVNKGLYYLIEHMTVTSLGGDLRDFGPDSQDSPEAAAELLRAANVIVRRRDSMYSHGIASLALTEAYAMTRDRTLRQPAEDAVKFIVSAQYQDGGWRYNPASESPGPGDMTVSGWQLAALKSALLAGIDVPYETWTRASEFVDGLAEEGGSQYAYVRGERGTPATTAIGLLLRMIGGWPRDYRPLQKGAALLAAEQPKRSNTYFNFYAAQVLHHLGGPLWEKWNPRMRDFLVATQESEGHEKGSWFVVGEAHSPQGGRLYTTAMSVMTLEVYYRYMPIYGEAFVGRDPGGQ
jgi:hypothetical protein